MTPKSFQLIGGPLDGTKLLYDTTVPRVIVFKGADGERRHAYRFKEGETLVYLGATA